MDLDTLKAERDKIKDSLRELEGDQRKLENELKALRQREIRAKREVEALSTLIDLAEARRSGDDAAPDRTDATQAS